MSRLTAYDKFIEQALKYGFSLYGIPKTGQVVSYQDFDDGYFQAGYPKSGAKYIDNGDGTISDKSTGLMWPKDGNGAGCWSGLRRNWSEVLNWANTLTFAGHSDWRIPNVSELFCLTKQNFPQGAPFIDTDFFTNCKSSTYWSSTTSVEYTNYALVVYFDLCVVRTYLKTEDRYVRAVRGGI